MFITVSKHRVDVANRPKAGLTDKQLEVRFHDSFGEAQEYVQGLDKILIYECKLIATSKVLTELEYGTDA